MDQPTILIIEDSASVRKLIEVCLRHLPVNLETAENGLAGLEAARRLLPDVIVLDIGLPLMDGWEVLSQIRGGAETQSIKILILTAHARPEVRAQADEGGADGFMTKPFVPDELVAAIQTLLPARSRTT